MGGITGILRSVAPLAGLALGPAGFGLTSALGAGAVGAGLGSLGGGGLRGALGGGLGAYGLAGGGGALGSALGAGSGAAGNALGSGLLGAAGGALTGGGQGALLGGALGGAGGYIQGSGGLGNAWDNITGASAGAAAPAGGLASSYGNVASNTDPSLWDRVTGALGGGGADYTGAQAGQAISGVGQSAAERSLLSSANSMLVPQAAAASSSNWLTPALSAGLGTFSNQRAQDQLIKGQEKAFNQLSPFLNSTFDASNLASDPGYQFQLQQGEQALGRQQAARGNYFSGEALREAADFNKGLTDTTLQDAYSRYANDQNRKIGVAGGLADIYGNIGNTQAAATTGLGNIFTGSLAAATGKQGVNATGQMIGGDSNNDAAMIQYLRSKGLI